MKVFLEQQVTKDVEAIKLGNRTSVIPVACIAMAKTEYEKKHFHGG